MPLGGFATSRTPLAAIAAQAAEDNINDVGVASTDVILELQCLCLISLLRTNNTRSSAIRDLETFCGVRTSAQAAVKSIFKQLSQSWKNLTNAQILAWNALAQTQAGKSVLGTSAKISGANLYSRLNYWIVFCGGEALSNPPALQGVEAPTEAVVTLTPTKFTFELEGEPENAADLKLIIMASAPQSNGVTRAYGKAVQIAQPLEAVCEEYDIKEDFDNKHGTPNAAAPKGLYEILLRKHQNRRKIRRNAHPGYSRRGCTSRR